MVNKQKSLLIEVAFYSLIQHYYFMTKEEYEAIISEKNAIILEKEAIIDSQKIELTVHQALIAKLEKDKLEWIEKYKIANDKKFCRKSEKKKPCNQRFLVNELEDGA